MVGKVPIDSGMVVVVFISLMYLSLVFGLLFYVQNDWCDLLYKNFTVSIVSINTPIMAALASNGQHLDLHKSCNLSFSNLEKFFFRQVGQTVGKI